MENPDDLAKRIDEAAKFVPMENLRPQPPCGFASTAEGNLITEARVRQAGRRRPPSGLNYSVR